MGAREDSIMNNYTRRQEPHVLQENLASKVEANALKGKLLREALPILRQAGAHSLVRRIEDAIDG